MNNPHDDLEQPHDGEPEEAIAAYDGPCECSEDGAHVLSVNGRTCALCDRVMVD